MHDLHLLICLAVSGRSPLKTEELDREDSRFLFMPTKKAEAQCLWDERCNTEHVAGTPQRTSVGAATRIPDLVRVLLKTSYGGVISC